LVGELFERAWIIAFDASGYIRTACCLKKIQGGSHKLPSKTQATGFFGNVQPTHISHPELPPTQGIDIEIDTAKDLFTGHCHQGGLRMDIEDGAKVDFKSPLHQNPDGRSFAFEHWADNHVGNRDLRNRI